MIKKYGGKLFTLESERSNPGEEVEVEPLTNVSRGLVSRIFERVDSRFTQEETLFLGMGAAGLALALGSEIIGTVVDGNTAVDLVGLGGGGMVVTAGLVAAAERITR